MLFFLRVVTTTEGTTAAIITIRTTIAKMKRERFDLRHVRLLTCFSGSDILATERKTNEMKKVGSRALPVTYEQEVSKDGWPTKKEKNTSQKNLLVNTTLG